MKNHPNRSKTSFSHICLITAILQAALTGCSDFPIKRDSDGFPEKNPEKSREEGSSGVSASTSFTEFQKPIPAAGTPANPPLSAPPNTPLVTTLKSDPVAQAKRELTRTSLPLEAKPDLPSEPPQGTPPNPEKDDKPKDPLLSKEMDLPALEKLARRIDYLETRLEDLGQRVLLKGRGPASAKAGQVVVTGIKPHPSDGVGTPLRTPAASLDPERGFLNDEPVQAYRRALITYKGKKYPEAILAFSGFLEKYPDHPFAGSAQYYVGDCYLKQGETKLAAQEFMRVLTSYDRSPHISDALKQISAAEDTLKQSQQAAKHRQQLTSLFASSPALTGLANPGATHDVQPRRPNQANHANQANQALPQTSPLREETPLSEASSGTRDAQDETE